ncbi:hypothetical protein [Arthrobacter russicus]|uniref:Methyltransferase n=2 Tax=Bacillati TaxID=1783272 RepID=A0ABU1JA51_9MICC|nr:hypothetical protein [Arthrobacter russicus]MDR6268277.1 hypothetical protein [Arthrobacter russicus]
MAKNTEVGNILSIPLENEMFAAAQIVAPSAGGGVFWIAAWSAQFAHREDITVELIGQSEPTFFVQTMDALLYHKIWHVQGWSETKATDYRPAFRRYIEPGGFFVADVFNNRQRRVIESEISMLTNEFSKSPAGVASTIHRFSDRENWGEKDERILIDPKKDVRNFFD